MSPKDLAWTPKYHAWSPMIGTWATMFKALIGERIGGLMDEWVDG
jgi:hypothetical protein